MNIEKIEQQTEQKITYYKEINSTHIHAKELEKQGDQILIAEMQTAGIGTKGRIWHTGESKNIAMTIIKHPGCKVEELEGLIKVILTKLDKNKVWINPDCGLKTRGEKETKESLINMVKAAKNIRINL